MKSQKIPVLLIGDETTTFSIAVCLLLAEHPVTLCTANKAEALKTVETHFFDLDSQAKTIFQRDDFIVIDKLEGPLDFQLAILVTNEVLEQKRFGIQQLESLVPQEALIAVNSESISLSKIQELANRSERIIVANWTEPVHTTFFLEVISNEKTSSDLLSSFLSMARTGWQKDPYVLNNDTGIRARMMSAMVREAFFLLENDYVSIEDIDRACRNDPGYYLPFAGHCRYMDLMGTYIYGLVMKDLNPELSKETQIPQFFTRIVQEGKEGLKTMRGFYIYEAGEGEKWMEQFRKFSYEIRDIISKYAFSELDNNFPVTLKRVLKT